MPEKDIVYIIENSCMPGLIKIGLTQKKDVNERMQELYSTGVPVPFNCLYAAEVRDCKKIEWLLHNAFRPFRVNPKREFFKMEADQVIPLLKELALADATPQINQALDNNVSRAELDSAVKARRPAMNYQQMGISPGAQLVFNDNDDIKAEVISERKVRCNGQETSLTALTRQLLNLDYDPQPTPHWSYNGRNLWDIYNETYPVSEL